MIKHLTMIMSLVFTISLLCLTVVNAEETVDKPCRFVDIDGDGIDDNARDLDEDGIPDIISHEESQENDTPAVELASNMGDFSMSLGSTSEIESSKSRASAFSSRKFSARGLSSDRGGIDSGDGFGPGSGIGIGAVKTPVCVGGVCRW